MLGEIHFSSRRGNVACRTAIESAPRLTSHPDLVTCDRCKGTGYFCFRKRLQVQRAEARRG